MRVSIFLSIVSVLLGIATFFIKLDTKPKIISSRIAALVFIILGVAFSYFSFKDMIADMKSEGSANSAFASQSSNHGSNVAIEGDNNITIYNGLDENTSDDVHFRPEKEGPKYELDTHMEWIDMECVESILTGKSALNVYSRAAG